MASPFPAAVKKNSYTLPNNRIIILLLLIIIPVFPLFFSALTGCSAGNNGKKRKPIPRANEGVLDLSGWDFEEDGPVALEGQWEFFMNSFLSPGDFELPGKEKRTSYVQVPSLWNSYTVNGKKNGADGYGTYRLQVITDGTLEELALFLEEAQSSAVVQVDNQAVIKSGTPGKSAHLTTPNILPGINNFRVENKRFQIVVRIANFHYFQGGFSRSLTLGTKKQIFFTATVKNTFDCLLFGSLFFMAFYHFILFLFRKKDRSSLYFGLCSMIIAIRTLLVNQRLLVYYLDLDWFFALRLEYLTVFLCVPAFLAFIHSLFPDEFNKNVLKVLTVLEIGYSVILFSPVKIFSRYMIVFHVLLLFSVIYTIFVLILSAIHKREGGRFLILGFSFFAFTIINDVLAYNLSSSVYFLPELSPLGILVFTVFQSMVISRRFSRTFYNTEKLSEELALKNLRLSKLDGLKDEFLANTSHELKTPLNGIIGIAESMINGVTGQLESRVKYNLYMMVASGRRLASLINDILDLARLKKGELAIQKKAVDLHGITDIVFALIKPLVKTNSLVLKNSIGEEIPSVYGDEARLQQILLNLVGNAVKFTKEGSVEVKAQLEENSVKVSVSDTGDGIPVQHLDTIFNSFERGATSISREYDGTGLGLAITKKLVLLHGGTIYVQSEPGRGSVFTFTLPVKRRYANEAENLGPVPVLKDSMYEPATRKALTQLSFTPGEGGGFTGKNQMSGNGPVIMIIDEDPVNRQVLLNHLSINKFRVCQSADAEKALDLIKKQGIPDLILLDIMISGKMSGLEFCRIIREDHDRMSLPVIFLTTRERISELVEGYNSGANDYITKPVLISELLLRIEILLDLKEKTGSLYNLNKTLEKQVDKRTEKLAEANRKIFKSIRYARKIQQTTLPDDDSLGEVFSDYFLIYKPCQIVGGDFYWLFSNGDHILFAVNDCTGHGVPGAFMAMIGNAVLNHIAAGIAYNDPARILSEANILIKAFLKQENRFRLNSISDAATDDGMDTGICYINRKNRQVLFSGARIGLFYLNKGRILEVKGNKQSLGYRESKSDYVFQNYTLDFDEQTLFYITSDGYVTQPGGGENSMVTFGNRRLQRVLKKIYTLPLEEQKERLEEELELFRGDEPQVDDITLMGFKVKL